MLRDILINSWGINYFGAICRTRDSCICHMRARISNAQSLRVMAISKAVVFFKCLNNAIVRVATEFL